MGGSSLLRRRAAEALLSAASLILALVGAEIFLRATDRVSPPDHPPRCLYWDAGICDMYAPHPVYGYALRPSTRTTYLYPDVDPRTLTVAANRHGFRSGRELDEADARRRLFVLGDSFVFGEGVEEEERFTTAMENATGWRVDNLGMTGWGPDLMLRALESVTDEVGADAVLLCLYTHDFRRVHPLYAGIGFPIPRFVLREGELTTVPYPERSLWQELRVLWAVSPARRRWNAGMWDVHEAILGRFLELARERGFSLGVVFLPGRADQEPDRKRREWLAAWADRHAVPFRDLTAPLLDRPRAELFIPENPHWSPAGHSLVARELAPLARELAGGAP